MKKITIIALVLCMFLLPGCTDATAKISDDNKVLFKIGKTTVTKGDIYDKMLTDDAGNTVAAKALEWVAAKEIETTDEILAKAEELYEDYIQQIKDANEEEIEDIEAALKDLGFASVDAFKEYCLTSVKADYLVEKYITENWDALLEEFKPLKARLMFVSGTDGMEEARFTIEEARQNVADGGNFEAIAESLGNSENLRKEKIYTRDNSTLDYNVLQYLTTVTAPELSQVITNKNANGYYVVQVTNVNYEQLKDEFIAKLTDDSTFVDRVHSYYLKAHNFTVYDIDIYNYLKSNYPAFIVQD